MPSKVRYWKDGRNKSSSAPKQEIPTGSPKNIKFLGELRTHSPSNDETDDYTCLWSCVFEPEYEESYPNLVATCGGNTICFIDCATMTVLRKYKHLEKENFITMAWTVLHEDSDQKKGKDDSIENRRSFSVLAAAGTQGYIKLLLPSILVCYAYLHGHRSEVYALCFSEKYPRRLLSAGNDRCILLWDLEIPKGESLESSNQCLCRFDDLKSAIISLGFIPDGSGFLAGCVDSDCRYYKISDSSVSSDNGEGRMCSRSFFGYEDNYHGSNVDCLHILDDEGLVGKPSKSLSVSETN
jgi:leucine-rich repeat and WD repeat-containing protein 1